MKWFTELATGITEVNEAADGRDLASNVRFALRKYSASPDLSNIKPNLLKEEAPDVALSPLQKENILQYSDEESRPRKRRRNFYAKAMQPRSKFDDSIFLPISKSQTRLATLYPGNFEDDIVCSIEVISFSELENREYDAICYLWDLSERRMSRIKIVRPDSVRPESEEGQNLWLWPHAIQAVRRIRSTETPINIWLDALCIDMTNDREKFQQRDTQSYGKVFSMARLAYIWVGESSESVQGTFK